MKIPAEPNPAQLVALVDSREQAPLDLTPLLTEPASLPTSDYSLRGLEEIVAIISRDSHRHIDTHSP